MQRLCEAMYIALDQDSKKPLPAKLWLLGYAALVVHHSQSWQAGFALRFRSPPFRRIRSKLLLAIYRNEQWHG